MIEQRKYLVVKKDWQGNTSYLDVIASYRKLMKLLFGKSSVSKNTFYTEDGLHIKYVMSGNKADYRIERSFVGLSISFFAKDTHKIVSKICRTKKDGSFDDERFFELLQEMKDLQSKSTERIEKKANKETRLNLYKLKLQNKYKLHPILINFDYERLNRGKAKKQEELYELVFSSLSKEELEQMCKFWSENIRPNKKIPAKGTEAEKQ